MANRVLHRISSSTNLPQTSKPKFVKYAVAWDEKELENTHQDTEGKVFELLRSDSFKYDVDSDYGDWRTINYASSLELAELLAEKECNKSLKWHII